jgi:thiamine-monophosphate kinase
LCRSNLHKHFENQQNMSRTEISTLGEFGLIKRLAKDITPKNESTCKGIGDDCAVLAFGGKQVLVTSDMLMEGVHFDLTYVPLKFLGYKAAIENISDIYAMNGTPQQMIVDIAIGSRFCIENIDELYSGIRAACEAHGVDIVGGDTTSSYTGLAIAIMCVGSALPNDVVYRSGARENDLICVSGDLGAAYMGLQLLEREKRVFQEQTAKAKTTESRLAVQQPDFSGHEYLIQRQLKPQARRDILERLRTAGLRPTAMIDVSDGLSSEVMHICECSNMGCRIYEDKLPIDYQTSSLCEEFRMNPVTAALNGGEDYELLFTVPLADYAKVSQLEDVHVVGNITTASAGKTLVTRDGAEFELKAQGWNPLSAKG